MCGIFGAVFVDDVKNVDVVAALQAIAHRGPDGNGIAEGERWTFGHRRLAVLDLTEAGAQPMRCENGHVVLTFNGEIYNHHELRRELEALGHRFRSRSDTEVILEGYRAWGDDIVRRLDGMFAFGIWDNQRQRLLLARDRVGKKPVYYARVGKGLVFASEIKALVAAGFPATIDEQGIPFLLAVGYVPAPQTLIRGVKQLPPASFLTLEGEDEKPVIRRYWRAPFGEPRRDVSEGDARIGVRSLVEAAVARRLEADVPLGAFLSGGIDSTIVVGVMARKMSRRVRTFSIGFTGDARFDETRYARIAARAFDTDHTEFIVEPSSFDLVERLVNLYDGPFGDSSAVPTAIVSMLTRRQVTVALTGDGGDELFCGYPRFLAAEAAEHFPGFARAATRRVLSLLPRPTVSSRRPFERAHRLLHVAAKPLPERLLAWTSLFDLDEVLEPHVLRSFVGETPAEWSRRICSEFEGGSILSQTLGHNFESFLPEDLLVKADRCSMGYSLELRSPFLDTALVEYVARLPDRFLRRGRTTKWLLRKSFADMIPREITTRGKMGFGVPLNAWFRTTLREYIQDVLNDGALCCEFVSKQYLSRIMQRHMSGAGNHGSSLWVLLTLEVWLRTLRRAAAA